METAKDLDTPSRFDYGSLDAGTRFTVETCRDEIRRREKRAAEDIIEIGRQLTAAREAIKSDTQFGRWREAEFGWSAQTARNLMNVFRVFGGRSTNFVGQPSALYALASGDVPEETREQFIAQAATDEPVRYRDVKAAIQEAKGLASPSASADVGDEVKGLWDDEPEPVPAPPLEKAPQTIWDRLEKPRATLLTPRDQPTGSRHRPVISSLSPLPPREGLPADKVLRELLVLTRMDPAAVAADVRRTDPTLARDCGEFVDRVTEWYTRLVAALQEQRAS